MSDKYIGEVECIQCGYCCGYRRSSTFGGCQYAPDEPVPEGIEVDEEKTVPVDANDVCIYLEQLDNGFARCTVHDKRPKMCRLYYCHIETKLLALGWIRRFLEQKRKERDGQELIRLIS